ncbi:hypothetical protein E2562_001445 [Oryza meyeriana var. granulata]|uniref:Uncharacterized protein n=1 Tax=Oryza meyeriana var. granulata TaxID=110450 RepID=A0A6G1DC70_9ORYZ|nr:hypothetical protein E2562_001445 [Oryza meyeriana var. granulata]
MEMEAALAREETLANAITSKHSSRRRRHRGKRQRTSRAGAGGKVAWCMEPPGGVSGRGCRHLRLSVLLLLVAPPPGRLGSLAAARR